MAIKKYKPTTPGIRGTVLPLYRDTVSRDNRPFRPLTKGTHRSVGRNSDGRITMRHRGSGHKRRYRMIDFIQDKIDIPARIETVEYDPNRSSFISLVCYRDGERRYILTPSGCAVGDTVITAEQAPIRPGNRTMVKNIPVGTAIYILNSRPAAARKSRGRRGTPRLFSDMTVRSHTSGYRHGRCGKVPVTCFASVGSVSNKEHHLRVIGKAGRNRWMGKRPTVRGNAMNPVDHPHGGGEGRQGRGRRRAVTKWGKPSGKGQKTRHPKRYSDKHIIRRRHLAKKRR